MGVKVKGFSRITDLQSARDSQLLHQNQKKEKKGNYLWFATHLEGSSPTSHGLAHLAI